MPTHEPYKRIEPISGSEPRKVEIGQGVAGGEEGPSKVKFDEAVSRADPSKVQRRTTPPPSEPAVSGTTKPSLMEVATKVTQQPTQVPPTPKNLSAQANDLRRQIERPRAVLIAEMENNPQVVQNLWYTGQRNEPGIQASVTREVDHGGILAVADHAIPRGSSAVNNV